jgi:hypothetical protein
MSDTATITGNLSLGNSPTQRQRIRWTGGNIRGRLIGVNFSDALFDNVSFYATGATHDMTAGGRQVERLAFLNCTLRVDGFGFGDSWAIFFLQQTGVYHNDVAFLNCIGIADGTHTFRLQTMDRLMIVDSALNPGMTASGSGCRIHRSVGVWIRDSWIRGAFHLNHINSADTGPAVSNALFDNLDRYASDSSGGAFAYYSSPFPFTPPSGTVQNCGLYNSSGTGAHLVANLTNGGGNTNHVWDGSTVPDYSTVGAIR